MKKRVVLTNIYCSLSTDDLLCKRGQLFYMLKKQELYCILQILVYTRSFFQTKQIIIFTQQ